MEPIRHDHLGRELLRALRGRRSREAFARRLGCSANAVYTWETGRREPPADVLLRAADRAGVPSDDALRAFLRASPAWLGGSDEERVRGLVAEVRATHPVGELAGRAGVPRFALSRWLNGHAVPRLPELLALIDAGTARLLDFVGSFVDPALLPSAKASWSRLQASRRLAAERPWAGVVLTALELDAYGALPAHDDAWLAQRTGLAVAAVAEALRLLEQGGAIVRRGARLAVVRPSTFEIRGTLEKQRTRAWGARRAAEWIEAGGEGLFAWQAFAVSRAEREGLERLFRETVDAMRAILLASQGGDELMIANLHLFPVASASLGAEGQRVEPVERADLGLEGA